MKETIAAADSARVVAIIPARGGSQGIRLKNLERVAGRSLLARAIDTALAATAVTDVLVSTDHPAIAAEAETAGACVVWRPAELSGAEASSESAVLHALDQFAAMPAATVLIQCTSPFIDPVDVNQAIERVLDGGEDTVFAVAENHNFLWTANDGAPAAVGHRAEFRPRRQDREKQYRETGSFYVMRTAGLQQHAHRFFGRLGFQVVAESTAIEIDTPADLAIARALVLTFENHSEEAPGLGCAAPMDEPVDIDALVTDFDGVHTDDHALVDADGTEHVRVSRSDGMGVARLRKAGIPQLILSTEKNPVVTARARKLQVDVLQNVEDKTAALHQWITNQHLDPARVAYVGNDVNDLAAMGTIGWPIAVANARPEVLAAARLVLDRTGGYGAVREICERVLAARSRPANGPLPPHLPIDNVNAEYEKGVSP